ncbi:MAG: hypothetical protein PHN82_09690 [bacterium]|nr:hypothetical protein [bacterium]
MRGVTIERIEARRDDRGVVFAPVPADILARGAVADIHVATMRPGAVRGNHAHPGRTESISFAGPMRIVVRDAAGAREQYDFGAGEFVRVTIAPGIAHAVVNTGTAETFIICSSDGEGGAQERVPLVPQP